LNQSGELGYDHFQLFEATLPYLYEIHLKNTDDRYHSTFGFQEDNLKNGIIDVGEFRKLIDANESLIPVDKLHCYLEIGGPKLGRDYSDIDLEVQLRESLQHLKSSFMDVGSFETQISATVPDISRNSPEVLISPSMMCVDPLNFENALRRVEALGVDMLHMDIMDGRFVPNAPMGLATVEELAKRTHLPIDVHLMVENNDFFIDLLKEFDIHQISIHLESSTHLDRALTRIRENGAKAGIAINPSTPLNVLEFILDRIDYVLLMTVNPGFAGQKMTPASIRKIAECRQYLDERGRSGIPIQVDGNVSFENIPSMVASGARNLVAGTSSIFHSSGSWQGNVHMLREAIRNGMAANQELVSA